MRYVFIAAAVALGTSLGIPLGIPLGLVGVASAQTAAPDTIPERIGNRANGFSYQPTPNEVVPRERAAGLRPPVAAQAATNRDLETIDRDLLRQEGDGSSSIPKFKAR